MSIGSQELSTNVTLQNNKASAAHHSRSNDQFISGSMHREYDARAGWILFDLLAELQYEIVYGARAKPLVVPPDVRQELIAVDGVVPVLPEKLQHLEFSRRHFERHAVT